MLSLCNLDFRQSVLPSILLLHDLVAFFLAALAGMTETWKTALCGSAFGAALTYSGVFLPDVIMAQMRMESFVMMRVFLTATASSAFILSLPHLSSKPNVSARTPSPLPRLGPYGGNVLGGLLVGFGMTLAGACPGTVFVQVGTGVPSGLLVLGGTALGAVAYQSIAGLLRRNQLTCPQIETRPTIPSALNCPKEVAVAGYIAFCSAVIYGASFLDTRHYDLPHPVLSGLIIGATQTLSVSLRGRPLGVSGVFSDTGKWFLDFIIDDHRTATSCGSRPAARPSFYPTPTQTFATGLILGSLGLSFGLWAPTVSDTSISTFRALSGGVCLAVGALLGGGCTSGHGISGMAMLGLASIVSVASMFAGGMALACFV